MSKTKQEIYNNRPTSPHITIYRKQISSVLSIFHRASGMALFFALLIMAWWFTLWVFSKFSPYYVEMTKYGLVKFSLIIISFAGFYHLCTGIRHLVWDTGRWFSVKAINISGWLAVISAFLMTISFWLFVI